MADLTLANSTYSAGPIDTYTAVSDGSSGTEVLAQHINGALSALVAIEGDIGTGTALKRSRATLAARLDTTLNANGAINGGTAFPSSPTPVDGQLFWRTDLKQLYIYDGALANWQRIDGISDHGLMGGLGDDDHTNLLNNARHDVTARHGTAGSIITDAVLSSNVPLKNAANVFTLDQEIQKTTPGLTLDATGGGADAAAITAQALGVNKAQLIFYVNGAAREVAFSDPGVADRVKFQMTDGKMTAGTVPLARMQRAEVSNENAGLVTVTGSTTTIATIDLGTVNNGDRIFVSCFVDIVKGATAGNTRIEIQKDTGTAAVSFIHNDGSIRQRFNQGASDSSTFSFSGMVKVTSTGTLTLKLTGVSAGSNATVDAGLGEIYGLVLNNG